MGLELQSMVDSSKANLSCYLTATFIIVIITLSNSPAFSYPSNVTLSSEQLTEVDKDPRQIALGCNQKIEHREDAGVLCDAFLSHIAEKCARFDNIFDYCTAPIGVKNYAQARTAQLACIKVLPSFNDKIRIEACDAFIALNSTYHNLPPS